MDRTEYLKRKHKIRYFMRKANECADLGLMGVGSEYNSRASYMLQKRAFRHITEKRDDPLTVPVQHRLNEWRACSDIPWWEPTVVPQHDIRLPVYRGPQPDCDELPF